MSTESPLTLSREDLYELAWSKPVAELAKDFGISGVALAKRCRKLGVPTPGRGYWARVAAGQEPRRPKLSQRPVTGAEANALAFPAVPAADPTPPPAEVAAEDAAIRAGIDATPISLPEALGSASPPIQRLVRRHRVIPAGEIAWARRSDRRGAVPEISVSDALTERALRIADALVRAADALGWPYEPIRTKEDPQRRPPGLSAPAPDPHGALMVAGEAIEFRIDEPQRRVEHVATPDEVRRRKRGEYVYILPWDYVPSGLLNLHIHEPGATYGGHTWRDGKRARIEDRIREILRSLYDMAVKIKVRRAEQAAREAAWKEQERLERERQSRRLAKLKQIEELERQAGAWYRARMLRAYVRAAWRALGERTHALETHPEFVNFLEGAERYLNQLDPLHLSDHDEDLREGPYVYRSDTDFQGAITRLTGLDGQRARKLGTKPPGTPAASDRLLGPD